MTPGRNDKVYDVPELQAARYCTDDCGCVSSCTHTPNLIRKAECVTAMFVATVLSLVIDLMKSPPTLLVRLENAMKDLQLRIEAAHVRR